MGATGSVVSAAVAAAAVTRSRGESATAAELAAKAAVSMLGGTVADVADAVALLQQRTIEVDAGRDDEFADFVDLLCRMLVVDPSTRITPAEAATHAFLYPRVV